jgi:hypothetical protein
MGKYVACVLWAALCAVSFLTYSAYYFPWLNSDDAIHILMAYDFSFPDDLYFRGQDRLGSIVPLLAHGLLKVAPLPPALAVSLIVFALHALGFALIASLFRSNLSRTVLAVAWFLPHGFFIELVRTSQPYSPSFTFLALGLFLADRAGMRREALSTRALHLYVACAALSLMAALWSSELTVFAIFLLVLLLALGRFLPRRAPGCLRGMTAGLGLPHLLTALAASALGAAFVAYAKTHATRVGNYGQLLAPGNETVLFLRELLSAFGDLFAFSAGDALASIAAWLALGVIAALVYTSVRGTLASRPASPWLYLFFGNAVVSFIFLASSNWVFLNDYSPRYFVVVYVSVWIAVLLYAERFEGKALKGLQIAMLSIAVLSGAVGPVARLIGPERPEPRLNTLRAFLSLGEAGIIGTYWNSYVICAADPARLKCTPHDGELLRGDRAIEEVLGRGTIYLVGDAWLDGFPDRIEQFGWALERTGEARALGGYTIAPYKRLESFTVRYPASGMPRKDSLGRLVPDPDSSSGTAFLIEKPGLRHPVHAVWGPRHFFMRGKYTVRFRLKVEDNSTDADIAAIEIASHEGEKASVHMDIVARDFAAPNAYQVLDLPFEKNAFRQYELRVLYKGSAKLWFDSVEVVRED